jgi:hypothetical protein
MALTLEENIVLSKLPAMEASVELSIAAQNGRADRCHELLSSGLIDKTDAEYAMVHACNAGHVDVVNALLTHGVAAKSRKGAALYAACSQGHVTTCNLLLRSGAVLDPLALLGAKRSGISHLLSDVSLRTEVSEQAPPRM